MATGALASLIASGTKLTDQLMLINELYEEADGSLSVAAKRIGGRLLFGRIWERLGIADVLGKLLGHRAFELAVERAASLACYTIFVSGSDRDCASWVADYDIPGVGEKAADALGARCVKDIQRRVRFTYERGRNVTRSRMISIIKEKWRVGMFRLSSEVSAIAFAVHIGFFVPNAGVYAAMEDAMHAAGQAVVGLFASGQTITRKSRWRAVAARATIGSLDVVDWIVHPSWRLCEANTRSDGT
jgi:hypothetical protein